MIEVFCTSMPNGYSCDMALIAQGGLYIFSSSGDIHYHVISETTALLPPQAQWVCQVMLALEKDSSKQLKFPKTEWYSQLIKLYSVCTRNH